MELESLLPLRGRRSLEAFQLHSQQQPLASLTEGNYCWLWSLKAFFPYFPKGEEARGGRSLEAFQLHSQQPKSLILGPRIKKLKRALFYLWPLGKKRATPRIRRGRSERKVKNKTKEVKRKKQSIILLMPFKNAFLFTLNSKEERF